MKFQPTPIYSPNISRFCQVCIKDTLKGFNSEVANNSLLPNGNIVHPSRNYMRQRSVYLNTRVEIQDFVGAKQITSINGVYYCPPRLHRDPNGRRQIRSRRGTRNELSLTCNRLIMGIPISDTVASWVFPRDNRDE